MPYGGIENMADVFIYLTKKERRSIVTIEFSYWWQ
jgi:hypothetical protein